MEPLRDMLVDQGQQVAGYTVLRKATKQPDCADEAQDADRQMKGVFQGTLSPPTGNSRRAAKAEKPAPKARSIPF